MTTWPQEPSGDDEDYFDPTAGIGGSAPPREASTDTAGRDAELGRVAPVPTKDSGAGANRIEVTAPQDWAPGEVPEGCIEHDFNDVLRIWLTPDENRLAKIRITNRWRERLRTGPDLAFVVTTAFRLNQAALPSIKPINFNGTLGEPTSGLVDLEFIDRWYQQLMHTRERLDALEEDPEAKAAAQGHFDGGQTVGRNSGGTVQVTLGRGALTERVALDEEWLTNARVSEICDGIQQAHDVAYANFIEPQYVPGEYDELQEQLQAFNSELLGRLNNHNGGRR